uniref:Plant heme peroxidase family profile domain-containing protein n=1 Tax=Aegilops tauschii subsp. strangulata TaxID=200361 RepID=A0A453JCN3_AEGTS
STSASPTATSRQFVGMASSSLSVVLLLVCLAAAASAQLSPTFYDASCPGALATIKSGVAAAVSSDPRMAASLLRLHFHDCFVQASSSHATWLLFRSVSFAEHQRLTVHVACAGLRRVRSAGWQRAERVRERGIAARLRRHRQNQGDCGAGVQAHRLLRRHPRRRRSRFRRRGKN